MVVLTIVAQKNDETIFFDQLIPQVHFMRLLSCSLYNSWDNLKRVAQLTLGKQKELLASIPQGHYNLQSLAEELTESLSDHKNKAKIRLQTNKPNSGIKIEVFEYTTDKEITVSHALHELINSGLKLRPITHVKKLNSPSAYFIHCDMIDKTKNFFNNKRSDLLAKFDVKGRPYEKVTYHASPEQSSRACSTSREVNSITLSVTDENGELFDFKGLPIEFELEIN